MNLYIRVKIGPGQFSDEYWVQFTDSFGEEGGLFCPKAFIHPQHKEGEALMNVFEVARYKKTSCVQLPAHITAHPNNASMYTNINLEDLIILRV